MCASAQLFVRKTYQLPYLLYGSVVLAARCALLPPMLYASRVTAPVPVSSCARSRVHHGELC